MAMYFSNSGQNSGQNPEEARVIKKGGRKKLHNPSRILAKGKVAHTLFQV